VLQPVRRVGATQVVAYSLGNFVWSAGSGATSATGILRLSLSARGVEGARLRPARIVQTRPVLT
jgi:poly-gamma-glutamate capsule biosynthesis protein CapA/YwtB (metallophosphatase superfamily)